MNESTFRVRYRSGDLEVEIESTDRAYVDAKLAELLASQTKLATGTSPAKSKSASPRPTKRHAAPGEAADGQADVSLDVPKVVTAIHESDNAAAIESKILDKKKQLNRILLVLYFADSVAGQALTTGEIETITKELGVKISSQNASSVLTGEGKKFVTADQVRRKGAVLRYTLNRPGRKAFEALLTDD